MPSAPANETFEPATIECWGVAVLIFVASMSVVDGAGVAALLATSSVLNAGENAISSTRFAGANVGEFAVLAGSVETVGSWAFPALRLKDLSVLFPSPTKRV